MTLKEALILSYVKRGIGYGYNILSHVRKSRSDEWVDFSRAGLYKTLEKLDKEGMVSRRTVKDGNRPPRKMYVITDRGEEALKAFLDTGFDFDFSAKNMLDSYLVTAVAASPDADELAEKVHRRLEAVRKHREALENEWPADIEEYPFIVYALYKRRMETLDLEINWLTWFESTLKGVAGDVLNMSWGEAVK